MFGKCFVRKTSINNFDLANQPTQLLSKKTADLIPLCHQLALSKIQIDIKPKKTSFIINCTVKCTERTGVEMEALTGVSVSALTIYDMCKALSHDIKIANIQLEKKSGGKSDFNR